MNNLMVQFDSKPSGFLPKVEPRNARSRLEVVISNRAEEFGVPTKDI